MKIEGSFKAEAARQAAACRGFPTQEMPAAGRKDGACDFLNEPWGKTEWAGRIKAREIWDKEGS